MFSVSVSLGCNARSFLKSRQSILGGGLRECQLNQKSEEALTQRRKDAKPPSYKRTDCYLSALRLCAFALKLPLIYEIDRA